MFFTKSFPSNNDKNIAPRYHNCLSFQQNASLYETHIFSLRLHTGTRAWIIMHTTHYAFTVSSHTDVEGNPCINSMAIFCGTHICPAAQME